jgi:hypothetical protein
MGSDGEQQSDQPRPPVNHRFDISIGLTRSRSRARGVANPRGVGWYRATARPHLHSDGSWDVDGPGIARQHQLDFVTLTDHNTFWAASDG